MQSLIVLREVDATDSENHKVLHVCNHPFYLMHPHDFLWRLYVILRMYSTARIRLVLPYQAMTLLTACWLSLNVESVKVCRLPYTLFCSEPPWLLFPSLVNLSSFLPFFFLFSFLHSVFLFFVCFCCKGGGRVGREGKKASSSPEGEESLQRRSEAKAQWSYFRSNRWGELA